MTYAKQRKALLVTQEYRCALCLIPFTEVDEMQEDHIIPRSAGGTHDLANRRVVHPWCHHQRHQQEGYKVLKA